MIWSKSLRSITSRCSGNEAAVLPRTLRGEDRERAAGIEPSKNPVKPKPPEEVSGRHSLWRAVAIYACTMFVLIRDVIRKVERRPFLANEIVKSLENNH